MGLFDSLFGIDSARNNIKSAGKKATQSLNDSYTDVQGMYSPYVQGGNQAYGNLLALSGVGGPGAMQTASDQFRSSPGYMEGLNEGIGAIDRSAAGRGGIMSGNTLRDLTRFGNDYASKGFGDYYNRIAGIANQGYNATGATAGARQNLGQGVAGIQQNEGNQLANADLASGGFLQNLIGSGLGAAGYALGGGFGNGFGVPTSSRTNNTGYYDPRRGGTLY